MQTKTVRLTVRQLVVRGKAVQLSVSKNVSTLPPASIVTRMIPQDQISAGCAMYGFTRTSGET